MSSAKNTLKNFEKSIQNLEDLVHRLEKGDLSLEESLKQFEKGIELARTCQNMLTEAQQKVFLLTEGSQQAVPFDLSREDEHESDE